MKRMLIHAMALCLFLAALPATGAEKVKLMYAASLYRDERGVGLSRPDGVGCTAGNLLVVADTGNGRLLTFTYQQALFTLAGEVKIPELTAPAKVQVSSQGDILVLDEKQRRIVRVGADGAFRGYVDPAGLPSPSAVTARSFALDSRDQIYLLDIASDRVLVLDPAGTFLREIRFARGQGFLSDLTVDSAGTVFAVDTVRPRVVTAPTATTGFAPFSEALREQVRFPTSIAADGSDLLWLVDRNGGSLVTLNRNGMIQTRQLDSGWKEGLLRYPSQVCVSGQGVLFIADRENNRVQAFTVVR